MLTPWSGDLMARALISGSVPSQQRRFLDQISGYYRGGPRVYRNALHTIQAPLHDTTQFLSSPTGMELPRHGSLMGGLMGSLMGQQAAAPSAGMANAGGTPAQRFGSSVFGQGGLEFAGQHTQQIQQPEYGTRMQKFARRAFSINGKD